MADSWQKNDDTKVRKIAKRPDKGRKITDKG